MSEPLETQRTAGDAMTAPNPPEQRYSAEGAHG